MIYRIILYFVISACSFAAIKYWNVAYRYDDYKDYLSLLSGVSGIVFTIMGIWIAFLYPNAISRILVPEKLIAKDFSENQSDASRLERIVGAILSSALVATCVLIMALIKVILFSTPFYAEYRSIIKASALSLTILLTLIQLESVFHVVISNVMFINDLHFKRQSRQADEQG